MRAPVVAVTARDNALDGKLSEYVSMGYGVHRKSRDTTVPTFSGPAPVKGQVEHTHSYKKPDIYSIKGCGGGYR